MENKIYKVIKIIDEYHIIVNAGSNDFIKENDKLEIFTKGEPIIDPDTNENLGTLDNIKAKLIAKQVFPKFCICGNTNSVLTQSSYASALKNLGTALAPYSYSEPDKLNVDPKEITGGLNNTDNIIKIGDLVRKPLS